MALDNAVVNLTDNDIRNAIVDYLAKHGWKGTIKAITFTYTPGASRQMHGREAGCSKPEVSARATVQRPT